MTKTFVLDTNIFLHDTSCLSAFEDNEVVIPIVVLDELDSVKIRADEVGRNARTVARTLNGLMALGSLSVGVKYGQSTIRVEMNCLSGGLVEGLSLEKVDNKILNTALYLKKTRERVIVVSKDINLRVKCDAVGIEAQDYERDKITKDPDAIYSGVSTAFVSSDKINELYKNKEIELDAKAFPNQFFVLKSEEKEKHSAIVRFKNGKFKLCNFPKEVWDIQGRSAEQKMALELLLDPSVKLVTMIGKAGSGKTLMACAAALHLVLNEHKSYSRILISRPVQPMGKDIGFLPGSVEEKMLPWMQPIYDNLELLLGPDGRIIDMYKEQGILHVEPLTYIRGRSIPNSFMILDEAQNISSHEIKTIITRMGENSKLVVVGDCEQIDVPYMDFSSSGLTHVIEKFKEYDIAGHITLRKGERSELATLASEIL